MIIADIQLFQGKYYLYDTVSSSLWTLNKNLKIEQELVLERELDNDFCVDLKEAKKTFGRWMTFARNKKKQILVVRTSPRSITCIDPLRDQEDEIFFDKFSEEVI